MAQDIFSILFSGVWATEMEVPSLGCFKVTPGFYTCIWVLLDNLLTTRFEKVKLIFWPFCTHHLDESVLNNCLMIHRFCPLLLSIKMNEYWIIQSATLFSTATYSWVVWYEKILYFWTFLHSNQMILCWIFAEGTLVLPYYSLAIK